MTAPSSPVPAVERIELPGGYAMAPFHSNFAGRTLYRLVQPDGETVMHVTEAEARAFAAAMSTSTPHAAAETDTMGEVERLFNVLNWKRKEWEAACKNGPSSKAIETRERLEKARDALFSAVRTIVKQREAFRECYRTEVLKRREERIRAETAEAQLATRGWQELGDWRPKPWVRIDLWIQCYDLADRDSDRLVPTVGKRVPSAVWFDGQWCNGDGNPHEDFEGFEDARVTHWRPEPAPPLSSSGADR